MLHKGMTAKTTTNIIIIYACIIYFVLITRMLYGCHFLNTLYSFYIFCLVALHLFVGK